MPNSTNPRSTSDSQPPITDPDTPKIHETAGESEDILPASSTTENAVAPDVEVPLQPPPPPPKPEIGVNPEGHRQGVTGRSLRMQMRYLRTLVWAARLFVRILFWQWVMRRIMGEEFVRRCNVSRWKQYAREVRAFAAAMGGVFIKAGQFISTRADICP